MASRNPPTTADRSRIGSDFNCLRNCSHGTKKTTVRWPSSDARIDYADEAAEARVLAEVYATVEERSKITD